MGGTTSTDLGPLAPASPESLDTRMAGTAGMELGNQGLIRALQTPTTARATMTALQGVPDTTVAELDQ